MGVEDVDNEVARVYLQTKDDSKDNAKEKKDSKKALLATIYEEPIVKAKSKEPQFMANRGFKRFLDFNSPSEFTKRCRRREQKAHSHNLQKQIERLAQVEPELQVNACGRPKRRAATVAEAANKVMTLLESPQKVAPFLSVEAQVEEVISAIKTSENGTTSSGGGRKPTVAPTNATKDKMKRKKLKPSLNRSQKETRETVAHLVNAVVSSVDTGQL